MIALVVMLFIAVIFLTVVFYSSHRHKKRWQRIVKRKSAAVEKRVEDKVEN